jgi:uncharacterized membrane protein YGL010W
MMYIPIENFPPAADSSRRRARYNPFVSPRAERLFADYAEAHRTAGNGLCHAIGIPMIVASAILALVSVRLGPVLRAAEPVIVLVAALEIGLDATLGLVFLGFAAACDVAFRGLVGVIGTGPALISAAVLFALGWAFQLVGHAVYEKNRPAFARNLRHLLIGPLWIARKAIRRRRASSAS